MFGYWDGDGNFSMPERPLLGRLGTWFEPAGERDDQWYMSRAAIATYWSIVPTPVRLMASAHIDRQWTVLLGEWEKRCRDKSLTFKYKQSL